MTSGMKFLVVEQTDVKAKAVFAKARIFGESRSRCCEGQDTGGILHQAFFFSLQYRMIGNQHKPGCPRNSVVISQRKAMALLYKLRTAPGNWSLLPVRLLN